MIWQTESIWFICSDNWTTTKNMQYQRTVSAMNVTHADKFASTDTGLLSAMHTFARYSGHQPVKSVHTHFKRRGVQIGVQPTAVGQQKTDSKRRLSADIYLVLFLLGLHCSWLPALTSLSHAVDLVSCTLQIAIMHIWV